MVLFLTLINFHMLNLTWSWYTILLLYFWVLFAGILLISASVFKKDIGPWFSYSVLLVLVLGQYVGLTE